MIVLDTNVVLEAMKPAPDLAARNWLSDQVAETLYLSSVTLRNCCLASVRYRRHQVSRAAKPTDQSRGGCIVPWTLTHQSGSPIIKVNQGKSGLMTAAFTVRVKDETASKLDQLAEKLDRSRSYMAAEAIEAFVEQQEWQLAEIEAGLAEADRGEFASEEDVAKVVAKYVKSARQS